MRTDHRVKGREVQIILWTMASRYESPRATDQQMDRNSKSELLSDSGGLHLAFSIINRRVMG